MKSSRYFLVAGILTVGAGNAGAAPEAGSLDDKTIFAVYDQVNGFDIETASLGATKGASEDVRALAVMVLRDHSAVRQMSRDLADRLGIRYKVPDQDASTQEHARALAGLRGKSGRAFDRAYLEHEIDFHRGAIKAVRETILPSVSSPELKKLITDVLPGFEMHLSHTLEAANRLGVPAR